SSQGRLDQRLLEGHRGRFHRLGTHRVAFGQELVKQLLRHRWQRILRRARHRFARLLRDRHRDSFSSCYPSHTKIRTGSVLRFRDQPLSDPALLAVSRYFRALDLPGPNPYGKPLLGEFPEINVISNVKVDGLPIGNLGDGEAVWHGDMTY